MKRFFIGMAAIAAMFTVSLTSCSNDEVENVATASNAGEAIGFQNILAGQVTTRATPTTSTEMNVTNNTFMVWGFYTSDCTGDATKNIAQNARYVGASNTVGTIIKYDGSNWIYNTATDKAYWPGAPLNFQAVTPYDYGTIVNDATSSEVSKLAMTIDVPADQSAQKDLMFGHEEGVTKTSHNLDVQLTFEHALSQIVFKAKTASTNITANISGVKINNIQDCGTVGYTGALTGDKRALAVTLASPATYDDYAIGMYSADVAVNSTTTAAQLNAANGTLMMLPQTTTAWTTAVGSPVTTAAADAANNSYLELDCKIQNGDTYVVGSTSAYGKVYIPFSADWAIGKKYTYTIIVGEGNNGFDEDGNPLLQPISYVVQSIEDWDPIDRDIEL